jgi:predicted transcriptional regulator
MGQRRLGMAWSDWSQTMGYKMRRCRWSEALNQTDFGYIVGLTQDQVSRYERGVTPVPVELQEKISCVVEILKTEKVLEVEVDG